jgi:hypothetical protein
MDEDFARFLIGNVSGIIIGLFIWGNLGASLSKSAAEDAYAKQHCEAKCAPTTPHFKAELVDGKFTCTCLVTP